MSQISKARRRHSGRKSGGASNDNLRLMKRWDSARTFKEEVKSSDEIDHSTKEDGSQKESCEKEPVNIRTRGRNSLPRAASLHFQAADLDESLRSNGTNELEIKSRRSSRKGRTVFLKKALSFRRKGSSSESVGSTTTPQLGESSRHNEEEAKASEGSLHSANQEEDARPCGRPVLRRKRSLDFIGRALERKESNARSASEGVAPQASQPPRGGKIRSFRNAINRKLSSS